MSEQIARGTVRTTRSDVLLASAGERGVLCGIYDEDAADTYHDLMQDADGTSEAREFANRVDPGSGPVLELAAGTGRVTFPFLALGFEVAALELSTAMIATLRKGLEDLPPEVRDRCTVVHGDMTAFALEERFETVIVSSGSINVLDDADRPGLYASVREHLAPGGRFLLAVAVAEAVKPDSPERQQELSGLSGRRYVLHAKMLAGEEIHEITICPADEAADPFVVCTNRIRLLKADQIVRELEQAGFRVTGRTPFASAGQGSEDVLLLEASL
ncbi:SAM-dependent methyltransferase [Amycolatopsis coloradensis]|uniref:SAM-dependent methyltransferase n=1 Tax=Amycolatopsis coloradensis TaxID=76021 RepID=A0A1R0KV53_9PSEU|nr:daptide-type RiPP biosynthesis methyltransferase [Amycolatopsis coloradensis]OLZ52446.1 SAM-dependent methyltransferase [Amycolatopsis coloradensis]